MDLTRLDRIGLDFGKIPAMHRALIRIPLLLLVTLTAHGANWLSRVFVRRWWPRRHVRNRNAAFNWWGRAFCWVCGCKVRIEGTPPRGEFFLVSNHVGYLDIIVLGTAVEAAFIGKADLRDWPVLGWAFATADTIFIDRGRKRDLIRVLEVVDKKIAEGYGILLFPEGTSGKGNALLRFKPSILQFPAARGDAVHFVTLTYHTPEDQLPPSRSVCWWGDESFFPHVLRMTSLPRFEAVLHFGDHTVQETDRKLLAEKLQAAMAAQFEPMP